MFGRNKEKIKQPEEKKNFDVKTIPDEFYGGQNPEIEFKKVKKEVDLERVQRKSAPPPVRKKEVQAFHKQTARGGEKSIHPANLFTSWKFLLLLAVGLFVIVGIVAGAYYGYLYYQQDKTVTPTTVETTTDTTTDEDTTDVTITTGTTVTTTTTSTSDVSLSKDYITYPSTLLGKGADLDGDKISDKAETIFGTDASILDSDKDTFPDGHEVYYLYNPASTSPKKLIDSSLIKEYTNNNYNYKLYYPTSWTVGDIASDKSDVLFTSNSGESVQVKVYSISATDTFDDWFEVYAEGENGLILNDFTSVFEQTGKARPDKLVYYFMDDKHVYVIVYVVGVGNVANYDAVIEMMARSFYTKSNTFVKIWAGASTTSTVTSTVDVATSTSNSTTSL